MKNKFITRVGAITMAALMLVGCGSETTTTDTTQSNPVSEQELTEALGDYEEFIIDKDFATYDAQGIYNRMMEEVGKYKQRALWTGSTDSTMALVSQAELYTDLDTNVNTLILSTNEGVEQSVMDGKNKTMYIATDYGWMEQEYPEQIDTFWDDVLGLSDIDSEIWNFSVDWEQPQENAGLTPLMYGLLDAAFTMTDGKTVCYIGLYIRKDNYLPEFLSIQYYDKSGESGETTIEDEEAITSYANVCMATELYNFRFYETLDDEDGQIFREATALPSEEDIITQEEYEDAYWKAMGNSDEENN